MENPQTTCLASLCPCSVTLAVKIVSWSSEEICVSVCAHCLWPCHWTPVHSLCTLPSSIYTHWWDPSEPSFLQMNSPISPKCTSIPFTISVSLCWTPYSGFIFPEGTHPSLSQYWRCPCHPQATCSNHYWGTKSPHADIQVMASSSGGQSREVTWAWLQKAAADKSAHSWAHQCHCSGLSSGRLADL